MRYYSHLNSAATIIRSFRGDMPFSVFIKKYFSSNKKHGSKDRKQIASLCYNFYRLGKAIPKLPVEEKIIVAVFLFETQSSDFLFFHKPEWNEIVDKPIAEKLSLVGITPTAIFPWADELSDGIDFEPFAESFFIQPDLFLRIRPGNKDTVFQKLKAAGIPFNPQQDSCIVLPNSTKIDTILELDKEVVIQDLNSQLVLNGIENQVSSIKKQEAGVAQKPLSVWDCCAASGGKSILAYDILNGNIDLTVSDIRESILSNLKKRFEIVAIKKFTSFVADITDKNCPLPIGHCQLIICDAPCSGSGTWSRTPEQLFYFKKKTMEEYVLLQQKIVSNLIPHVPSGGIFMYITCSIFKQENELMAAYIKEKFHLQLLQMECLKGYDKKADSMFVASFRKE